MPLLLAAFARRQKQQQRPPKGEEPAAPHNLAAITMLCMQAGYEDRAIDFMPALFAELPGQVSKTCSGPLMSAGCMSRPCQPATRMLLGPAADLLEVSPCLQEYCALTLPHSAAQPEQLARHMALLRPVPGCSFPQVVLLLHRAGLALHMGAGWEVRGATHRPSWCWGTAPGRWLEADAVHSQQSNGILVQTRDAGHTAAPLLLEGPLRSHGRCAVCRCDAAAAAAAVQVRLAVPDDVVALHQLMGGVSNALDLQEAFLHAVGVTLCSPPCSFQQCVLHTLCFPQHCIAQRTCRSSKCHRPAYF